MNSSRMLLLPVAVAAFLTLLAANATFAQTAPAAGSAAQGRSKGPQWAKYQQDVMARERAEHAQRVEAARAAALKKEADEARRVQAEKDEAARRQAEADRQALAKKQAAHAYEKSVTRREIAEHAQRVAMAPTTPAKPPVAAPVAIAPKPPASPSVTPAVKPPVVAAAPATPPVTTPPATAPVKPPVATIAPAGSKAYETGVRDREAQEHAQGIAAENQKKADLAARRKEIVQHEEILKSREIREHSQREQARKAAEAARNAATFDFGI